MCNGNVSQTKLNGTLSKQNQNGQSRFQLNHMHEMLMPGNACQILQNENNFTKGNINSNSKVILQSKNNNNSFKWQIKSLNTI